MYITIVFDGVQTHDLTSMGTYSKPDIKQFVVEVGWSRQSSWSNR